MIISLRSTLEAFSFLSLTPEEYLLHQLTPEENSIAYSPNAPPRIFQAVESYATIAHYEIWK